MPDLTAIVPIVQISVTTGWYPSTSFNKLSQVYIIIYWDNIATGIVKSYKSDGKFIKSEIVN